MTKAMDFVKTALLGLIAASLIFLLVRIDFLVNDLKPSLDPPEESYRVHEPQGQLIPKSDPSPSDLPSAVDPIIFV